MQKSIGRVLLTFLFSVLLCQEAHAFGHDHGPSSPPSAPTPTASASPSSSSPRSSSPSRAARVRPVASLPIEELAPSPVFWALIPPGSGGRALGFAGTFTAIADDATAASWNPAGLIQLERPEVSAVYRFTHVTLDSKSKSDEFQVGEDVYESMGLNYISGVMPFFLKPLKKNAVLSVNYQEVFDFEQLFTIDFAPREVDGGTLERSQRFTQQGTIDAFTPALAVELGPRVSVGAALNLYTDSLMPNREIRNSNRSAFTFTRGGETITGLSEETGAIDDLEGLNVTLGVLAHLNKLITAGLSVDFPWTAESTLTEETRLDTTSSSGATESTESTERMDFDIDFPLQTSLGLVLHHTQNWYTGFDVSYATWSDFAFITEGAKFNPLDGSPFGVNRIDDTWAFRVGSEYLIMHKDKEIPVRGGVMWEQRPSLGSPNEYVGFSLGSGIGVEMKNKRLMIDLAYSFRYASDTRSPLAAEPDLSADAVEHQTYLSGILHF